jgi:hypothetical protein
LRERGSLMTDIDNRKSKKARTYLRKVIMMKDKIQILHRTLQLRKMYSQVIPEGLEEEKQKLLNDVSDITDKIISLKWPYDKILYMRFVEGKTPLQTAMKMEISERHIYRLQKEALTQFYDRYLQESDMVDE